MLNQTQAAIRKIAWHTAQHDNHKDKHIRQRAKDAQAHCRKLGIDWTKPLGYHACPDETATVVNNQWVCHCPK